MAVMTHAMDCCTARQTARKGVSLAWAPTRSGSSTVRARATRTDDKVDKLLEGVRALEKLEKLTTSEEKIPLRSIDNLDSQYCDDFECTSSPAVEATVRAFARDIMRQRYTALLFNKDVAFSDGFRNFKGVDKYTRKSWYQANLYKPQVTIVKMRMLDKSNAEVQWRIAGNVGSQTGNPVEINVASTIELNLLTGRIVSHKEKWDLSRLSPQAAASLTLGRWAWSLTQAAGDARAGVTKTINDGLSSIDGSEDPGQISNNPTDPTKFFFDNQQQSQFNDYVSYATVAALLYFLYRAFAELNNL